MVILARTMVNLRRPVVTICSLISVHGHHRLTQIHHGTGKNHHQSLEAHSLNESTNRSTQEEHQSCIGNPAKLKGAVEYRQMNRTHQMILRKALTGGQSAPETRMNINIKR